MKNETKVVSTRVTLRLAKLIEEFCRGDLHLNPADLERAWLRSKSWRQKVRAKWTQHRLLKKPHKK